MFQENNKMKWLVMMDIFSSVATAHSLWIFCFWDDKKYLLDPVCIFIVLVNYVFGSFIIIVFFLNVSSIFAPASKKTAGIVLCQSVCFFVFYSVFCCCCRLFHTFQALWTKGTFHTDLTQHLTLPSSLSCVQTERWDYDCSVPVTLGFFYYLHPEQRRKRAKKKKRKICKCTSPDQG